MALTKSDIPDLLLPGLRAEFEIAYRSELDTGVAERVATIINTTLPVQKYPWLGSPPPMREFLDERRPSGLNAFGTAIEDKVFESSIAVDRRAVEDDQLDLIRLRVRDLAQRVAAHRHQIVIEQLASGFAEAAYDGVPFFSNDHPTFAGATHANVSTSELADEALKDAIDAMMSVTDDHGVPLGIEPDTLVVGPKLQWTATELLESPVTIYRGNSADTAGATDYKNVLHGRMRLVVSPFLRGDSADDWFLLDTKRPVRSVLLQQRSDVPVEFSALEAGSGSESAWMRDRYFYGVRARYNVGFGLWQAAFGGRPSL